MTKTKKDDIESSLSELEKITEQLQDGELGLEKSLEFFEAGLDRAEKLKKRLSEIENKIETIKLKADKKLGLDD